MRVGIIGYGHFGQFMAVHLAPHVEVRTYDINGKGTHTLEETCDTDCVIFAVPVQTLQSAALDAARFIKPHTRIADVSSVKVVPLSILSKLFSSNEILGTHPIFGPQSGKGGIQGLTIVLSNYSWSESHYSDVKEFLSKTLQLAVLERTPDDHDREMAEVQALAHYIGRALRKLDIKDFATATKSYRHLIELRDLLSDDSWELFETIEMQNPYASKVRVAFRHALDELDQGLATSQ
jgi:prephenate dehydrogenase